MSTLKIDNFDLMFDCCFCRLNRVVNENFCQFFFFAFDIDNDFFAFFEK